MEVAASSTATAVFTLIPVDDDLHEPGGETVRLTGYADITVNEAVLTITDDDPLGLVLGANPLEVSEGDEAVTARTTVRLATRPTATVAVGATSTGVTVTPGSLTFAPEGWDTAQELTVTVEPDADGRTRRRRSRSRRPAATTTGSPPMR